MVSNIVLEAIVNRLRGVLRQFMRPGKVVSVFSLQ